MKKLLFTLSFAAFSMTSAQELSAEQKKMISYDSTDDFSTAVTKENIDLCYKNQEASYSLLALAIKTNRPKVFQKLLDSNADLEKICDGKTPLMFAAKYGNVDFTKKLLEKGAKKTTKTSKGYTALDYAKKYEMPEIIKLLE